MRPILVFLVMAIATAESKSEGDALNAWKTILTDPNVLQSWYPTLFNPCTWYHVTSNSDNSVTRGLEGHLVPELGIIANLQYLHIKLNKISGEIPRALGNLTKLVSLGLDQNQLNGSIPETLCNLRSLRLLNVSDNQLAGTVHHINKTGFAASATTIIQDAKD